MASPTARRRQRSARVAVAVGLVAAAGLLVAATVPTGSFAAVAVAGVLAVVLGAAALKIAHSELMDSRRAAATDRAVQAKEYAALAAARADENATFIEGMNERLSERDASLDERRREVSDLEEAVALAQAKVVELTRRADAQAKRAEAESTRAGAATERAEAAESEVAELRTRLSAAEERAAEAIVRLAELEQELDVVRADLVAWESTPGLRKRA